MKEKLNTIILIFTRFATAIFLIDSIALLSFKGKEAKLYALDVLIILGIAFICALLYVLLLSDRNLLALKTVRYIILRLHPIQRATVRLWAYFLRKCTHAL